MRNKSTKKSASIRKPKKIGRSEKPLRPGGAAKAAKASAKTAKASAKTAKTAAKATKAAAPKARASARPKPSPRERSRETDRNLRNQPKRRTDETPAPKPSDLERPAPNEPVRIQPPAPRFAKSVTETSRGDPEAALRAERRAFEANRWVHQRSFAPRRTRANALASVGARPVES